MCVPTERHVLGRRFGRFLQWKHKVSVRRYEGAETDDHAQCPSSAQQNLRDGNGEHRAAVFQTRHVQHGAPVEGKRN